MFNRRNLIGAALSAPMLYSISSTPVRAALRPAAREDRHGSMAAFIAGMPKAEFDVHLEGTLEAEMKFALARRNGLTLPFADVAAMREFPPP